MKNYILALVLVVGLCPPSPLLAAVDYPNNVKQLAEACEGKDKALFIYCFAMVKGVFETLKFTSNICIYEEGVTLGQQIQILIDWVEKNPRSWGHSAEVGFAEAMIDRWPPCPEQ